MLKSTPVPDDSLLIVAHPDDEVLWFGSLLAEIDRVIIVFQDYNGRPGLGERRAKAIADLPFEVTCLAVPEAGSYELADWSRPEVSPYGLVLEKAASKAGVSRIYESNFYLIRACLKKQLRANMNVFTHNPWGEYGHEDHVQVYRVVESLRAELGFALRVSCYISSRSKPLAQNYADSGIVEPMRCRIDPRSCNDIAAIYKRHGCWTWVSDWVWDKEEYFHGHPLPRAPDCHLSSLASSPLLLDLGQRLGVG